MQKQLGFEGRQLIAFFKGTAGEFLKAGPQLAITIMGMAADVRNHVSPFTQRPCSRCEGQGVLLRHNGPEDFDKETCGGCNGTGRVLANN
jgi:DnaJ-class molecular chaperone